MSPNLALVVHRTPAPFDFKLHTYIRPYLVEGAQEMIEEGFHREAMLWIVGFLYLANTVIHNDGDEGDKRRIQAVVNRLEAETGMAEGRQREERKRQVPRLAEEMFRISDEVVAGHPDIFD